MFERFTDRSRKVMALANQEALRYKHEYIGTEHILLGLLKEGSGVGANVMKTLGVDLRKVREEVEKLLKPGAEGIEMSTRLMKTERAKRAIEFAIAASRELNHKHIGTEHLLLGLLREEEGVADRVLANFGLTPEKVAKGITDMLSPSSQVGEAAGNTSRGATLPPSFPRVCPEVEAAFGQAVAEARLRKAPEVRLEHLLLGLLSEPSGQGLSLLAKLGVTPEAVRKIADEPTTSAP